MQSLRDKKGFICDMDGVIYHGNFLLPGVKEFLNWLNANGKKFLFLTNSSERSPRELQMKLARLGLDGPEEHFYTSALATATFLSTQRPGCSAYVIGEPGLINALYNAGITMNDVNPDYVVMGETRSYNFEKLERAIHLVQKGARLIGTNSDLTGPVEGGIVPATRALISPIELATGKQAHDGGKPTPLMRPPALKQLATSREDTAISVAGIETELDTVLVLSGVTSREMLGNFPYCPKYVLSGVGEIPNP